MMRMNDAMVAAMDDVGQRFQRSEIFVPFSTMYRLQDWLWTYMMAEMTSNIPRKCH